MAKLVCEICGGRLVMGGDGILQCESCGSCYSKQWAKNKAQEITGTVQVDGVATTESLLKRAQEYFNAQDFVKAIDYSDRILDINPSHGAAREIRQISTNQLAEHKKDSASAQHVDLFQIYKAVVLDILEFECKVRLIKSGKIAHIHASEISDPPPKRIADAISAGDSVSVTIIEDTIFGTARKDYLSASLLPPEAHAGYYLRLPSVAVMKKALENLKTKFSPRMILQAKVELEKTKSRPDSSLNSSGIEDRIVRCELLLAKALRDNPNYAIEMPLKTSLTGVDVDIAAWKTKEMQKEAKRIWEMGKLCAKILNDSSWGFSFLRRLLDFISPDHYFCHDSPNSKSSHTEYFEDEGSITTALNYGKLAFAYGNIFVSNGRWVSFPFDLPDIETLKCWFKNYKNKNCFAGGSLSFWSSKSSICHCTPEQCHIDNPECPLRNT